MLRCNGPPSGLRNWLNINGQRLGGSRVVYDITIVGAGIVGLATAFALKQQNPHLHLAILEKEAEIASHQTGHNSGVIHAGIYYAPGSLKARLCIEGAKKMIAFCEEYKVPYELCGKVIVATEEQELPALETLYQRGLANGVPGLRKLDSKELADVEPHAAGLAALYSPNTGIIDYRQVAGVLARLLKQQQAHILTEAPLLSITRSGHGLQLQTPKENITTQFLVNCAGLYSDHVARMAGLPVDVKIIPFRGEYYWLVPERATLVRGLIYPVPDPRFPFLGVHFTRTIHGGVEAGPNAVLAFAREGYTRSRVHWGELKETLGYPGFWALARKYWRAGLYEIYRSLSKEEFTRSLQKLVPAVSENDLAPGGSGVRAQAVTPDGRLVDDFHFAGDDHSLHVLNAPSPAATASLAIGEYIAGKVRQRFKL